MKTPSIKSIQEVNQMRKDAKLCAKIINEANRQFTFELANRLYLIHTHNLYKSWDFSSFRAYVQNELDISIRSAQYYVAIYKKLCIEFKVDRRVMKKVGWSKLATISGVIKIGNQKQLDGLLVKALNMNAIAFGRYISSLANPTGNIKQGGSRITLCYPVKKANEIRYLLDNAVIAYGVNNREELLVTLLKGA